MRVTVTIDRVAFHQFHHKVRDTLVSRPAIKKPGDIRMVKTGQNLPLVAKAFENRRRIITTANDFDGNFFLEFSIGADRPVYLSHSATTNLFDHEISADATSGATCNDWQGSSQGVQVHHGLFKNSDCACS